MNMLDLTQPICHNMSVFPGTPAPELTNLYTMDRHGFRERRLCLTSHTGTHMDAPAHMLQGGKTLDQHPVSAFTGRAYVLDCWGHQSIPLAILQQHEAILRSCD